METTGALAIQLYWMLVPCGLELESREGPVRGGTLNFRIEGRGIDQWMFLLYNMSMH